MYERYRLIYYNYNSKIIGTFHQLPKFRNDLLNIYI